GAALRQGVHGGVRRLPGSDPGRRGRGRRVGGCRAHRSRAGRGGPAGGEQGARMSAYVYLVRPGDQNDELRYSLRSLEANLPPGDVVIVGYCPTWVTGVLHIRGNRFGTHKQRNVYDNVLTAAHCDVLPDQVVWMNDDFITLAPAVPAMAHRCTLAEHIDGLTTRSWWWRSLKATDAWLRHQGHDDPLSFELHRPLPGDRHLMAEVLT